MPRARPLPLLTVIRVVGMARYALGFGRIGPVSGSGSSRDRPFNPEAHLRGMRVPAPLRVRSRWVWLALILVLLIGGGIYAGYRVKLDRDAHRRAIALTHGDPDLGRRLAQRYGCSGCHIIPGVPGAQGRVGPSLQGFAARIYIGGVAANAPGTLIQWIENPRSIAPKTAMPVTGISQAEARHVAAYLYTLR